MLKKLTLMLCFVTLVLLAACKQDTTVNQNSSSTPTDESSQISGGIELEEDVFDDSDIQSSPSDNTLSTISKDDTTVSNNESTDKTSSESSSAEDTSSGDTSSNTSADETPDTEDSNDNQEDVEVGEDGVIKLPIDKFN